MYIAFISQLKVVITNYLNKTFPTCTPAACSNAEFAFEILIVQEEWALDIWTPLSPPFQMTKTSAADSRMNCRDFEPLNILDFPA